MQNLTHIYIFLFLYITPQEIVREKWNQKMKDSILYFNDDESIVAVKWIKCIQYGIKQKKKLLNSYYRYTSYSVQEKEQQANVPQYGICSLLTAMIVLHRLSVITTKLSNSLWYRCTYSLINICFSFWVLYVRWNLIQGNTIV